MSISGGSLPSTLAYFDLWTESPSGRRVAYFRFDGPAPGPGGVIVCDRDGGEASEVGRSELADAHTAARQQWIDDDTLAFNRPGPNGPQAVIVSLATGRQRILDGAIRTYNQTLGLGVYSSHDFRNYDLQPPEEAVYTLDLATGKSRRLFTRQDVLDIFPQRDQVYCVEELNFKHTKWSPDGRRFFCVFNNEMAVKTDPRPERLRVKQLVVCDPTGGNLRWFRPAGGHPMWMPDSQGTFSYFAGGCWACPLDGGEKRLVHGGPGIHGSFSPDGRRFVTDAINYPHKGQAAVLLYEVGGEKPTILAVLEDCPRLLEARTHAHPVWSRDGQRVYFNCIDSGLAQLHAVEVPAATAGAAKEKP